MNTLCSLPEDFPPWKCTRWYCLRWAPPELQRAVSEVINLSFKPQSRMRERFGIFKRLCSPDDVNNTNLILRNPYLKENLIYLWVPVCINFTEFQRNIRISSLHLLTNLQLDIREQVCSLVGRIYGIKHLKCLSLEGGI